MSKKKTHPWCLVIDCSIGHAAGSGLSSHSTAIRCGEFLSSVRNEGFRMAWSEAIEAEWERHQSVFAAEWLVSMMSLKKLRRLASLESKELREQVEEFCPEASIIPIVLKDCHLIEAALATDSRVASSDERVRGHLCGLSAKIECLRGIVWVNPVIEDEKAIECLERGAPAQKKRYLHA